LRKRFAFVAGHDGVGAKHLPNTAVARYAPRQDAIQRHPGERDMLTDAHADRIQWRDAHHAGQPQI
jgi:hypothetical protein